MIARKLNFTDLISLGSLIALAGYVLSGPVAFIIVQAVKPQPRWSSAPIFAEHYHAIQDLPYYFGFLLIGGMLMVSVAHYLNFKESENFLTKFHLLVALGWTVVFCASISFNYICQTTFVRNLALHYKPEHDFAIATFSMANPLSFCWANEMWGYGFLGISTLLTAGYYTERNKFIKGLMIANGIVSICSVIWTIIDINWVMTTVGLICYFIWNVLMIVMMAMIYFNSRNRTHI